MKLIGLAGPPGSGKRTVADILCDAHDFYLLPYLSNIPHAQASRDSFVFIPVQDDDQARTIRAAGGQIWLIQRPGYLTRTGAPYKGISVGGVDRGIYNDGSLAALHLRVIALLGDMA